MGYCYTRGGGLCCDICGGTPAKKKPCPHGYCQPIACCENEECKAKLLAHRQKCKVHCKKASEEYHARDAREKALLAAGHAVRCSAKTYADNAVHVLFKRKDMTCEGWYMATPTYHAIPYSTPATPDDYRQHGELLPAPSDYYANA